MTPASYNCIICAQEITSEDNQSVALANVNITNFKVCQACLDHSDPKEDYRQVRDIVYNYLKFAEAKSLLAETRDILHSLKK